jgi:histidinol dehydrogenase
MIRIIHYREAERLLQRRAVRLNEAEQVVGPILDDVRKRGDEALLEYARRYDGLEADRDSVELPRTDIKAAYEQLAPVFLRALRKASRNIRSFASMQLPKEKILRLGNGQRVGQIVRPLDAMAAYIPSGRYPLPSTLLMTVIPAQEAKVPTVCVASPRPSAEILGAAGYLRVTHLFRMGGAHAIAAFAFGTGVVPKVERIVGPGNIYVAAAKKLLAGEVGIDFVAGPTEILIIAKEGDPKVLAADMLAQAEHDEDASAILLTTSRRLASAVAGQIERQLQNLPTALTARTAIDRNSAVILVPSLERGVVLSNRFAPEHLSIPDKSLLKRITNAGSVFVGPNSPEAAGDYASGPNHVLPTSGFARMRGGLSTADFVKVISVQELTRQSLLKLAPAITTLARAEGLEAHARSVEVRTRG